MDFTQPWDFGDITFTIEDKKIYANKQALMMSSKVFKTMFTLDFAEKEMTDIPLPDKKFDDFLQLMKILHPQTLKRVDGSNVHNILPLAHEYQINHVYDDCVKILTEGSPSVVSMNIAERYKLTEVQEKCLQYLKKTPLSELKSEAGFAELNPDTLMTVLIDKCHRFESLVKDVNELTSYYRVDRWVQCDNCLRHYAQNKDCGDCMVYRLKEVEKKVKKYTLSTE